jgi:PAS domain S-box-containing protein
MLSFRTKPSDEALFRAVVEAAPNAIVMTDGAARIALVNMQAEQVFGYARAELVGQPVEMLVPQRYRFHHPKLRMAFLADPRARPMGSGRDLYALKKDGNEFPVEIGLSPIETDEGTMVLLAIVDITARKAAEVALLESERSLLIDGVVDYAIYMLDPSGIIRNWNRGARRIKGYEAEEVVGRHFACFFTEEDRAANVPQRSLEIAARDGHHESQGLRVRKDGSHFLAEAVVDAVKDANGRLVGFAKVTRDITERVQAAREIEEVKQQEMRLQLAHENRLATLGQLTASIAHEVNQPLGAAVNYANAALRWLNADPPDLKEAQDALDAIVRAGNRASAVLGRIRDMVKKAPAEEGDISLNEKIPAVLALTSGEAARHEVAIRVELAPDLPTVRGDQVQLQQVLLNLIVNAIEAMSTLTDGPRELVVGSQPHGESGVAVFVRDTGPGLASEALEQIFMPFYTNKGSGLGMGLAICASIIEAHGGRIWASPSTSRGAVFQFTLPSGRAA